MLPNWDNTSAGSWCSAAMFALSELTLVTRVVLTNTLSRVTEPVCANIRGLAYQGHVQPCVNIVGWPTGGKFTSSSAFSLWKTCPLSIWDDCNLCTPLEILLSTLRSLASVLLNDALRLDNELSNLAVMSSLRSVSKMQTLEAGCIFPV